MLESDKLIAHDDLMVCGVIVRKEGKKSERVSARILRKLFLDI